MLGDLNPLLYEIAEGAGVPGFRTIELGANAVDQAHPGFDMVTGLGTRMPRISSKTCWYSRRPAGEAAGQVAFQARVAEAHGVAETPRRTCRARPLGLRRSSGFVYGAARTKHPVAGDPGCGWSASW